MTKLILILTVTLLASGIALEGFRSEISSPSSVQTTSSGN